ncbi:MAG TPA: hypothetical protein DCX14_08985 [Flavobacteriales bacterium]|nr:hypothetical protein [Flavobacteriales bacterium]
MKRLLFLSISVAILGTGCKKAQQNTIGIELIDNGDFEDASNATVWERVANDNGNPNNFVGISNVNPSSGQFSMELHHDDTIGCYEQWISQSIDIVHFVENQKYKVAFSFRADFNVSSFNIILRNDNLNFFENQAVPYSANSGWKDFEYELTLPSTIGTTNPDLWIHICHLGNHSIWIDEVSMKAI